MIHLFPAASEHHDAIWHIFHEVIQGGDAYVFPEHMSRSEALAYWLAPGNHAYVAVDGGGQVVGSYILKPNQPGRGAHVANGSYMTAGSARGMGVGSIMAEHSIAEAERLGYRAIQFNIVVSTNGTAVRLWQRHGFKILATLPQAFHHSKLGYVDAYLMHRFVGEAPADATMPGEALP
jgi:L-amino acid N-acyltransferase YncA